MARKAVYSGRVSDRTTGCKSAESEGIPSCITRKLLARIEPGKRNTTTHFDPRESDVFIFSYPRSGSTWVRFLLANLTRYDSEDPVDLHSVHRVIPDIMQRAHREVLQAMPSPRLLKSDHPYDSRLKTVIYVLRDGRDVMVSYYHLLSGQGRFEGSFLELLDKEDLKPCLWHEHVESWLLRDNQDGLLLIRYEDLHRQTEVEVARMARFIGLPCDKAQLDWAVSNSGFETMHRVEAEKGRAFYADRRFLAVRKGTIGDWGDHFDVAHKNVFKRYANRTLLQFGYVENENWWG